MTTINIFKSYGFHGRLRNPTYKIEKPHDLEVYESLKVELPDWEIYKEIEGGKLLIKPPETNILYPIDSILDSVDGEPALTYFTDYSKCEIVTYKLKILSTDYTVL